MKVASLDQHRGYAQDHYTEVKQDHETEYLRESEASAYQVLREPLWNKGRQTCAALCISDAFSFSLPSYDLSLHLAAFTIFAIILLRPYFSRPQPVANLPRPS